MEKTIEFHLYANQIGCSLLNPYLPLKNAMYTIDE